MLAATNGQLSCVELLLEKGANVRLVDSHSDSALHLAATAENNEGVIAALLQAGAEPDRNNSRGFTAMHFSSANGRFGAVKALLEGGASLGETTSKGETPLDLARAFGKAKNDMSVATLLRQNGARSSKGRGCILS